MNEQELNKKLAKWAGFKEQRHRWYFELTKRIFDWLFPDGQHIGALPNFTQSLDACFKWLVLEIKNQYGGEVLYKLLEHWAIELALSGEPVKPEALALCLAIEKLIDSDVRWQR